MPRIVEYPHASFSAALEIAAAVDYLGGSCTASSCADRLNRKIGGAFKSSVNASTKHGLITSKRDILSVTELYKLYKLAYNEQEKMDTLRKAFLMPVMYRRIYERFKGKELPVSMLDKLLIREFQVEDSYASRVTGYFVDGANSVGMLDNGRLIDNVKVSDEESEDNNDTPTDLDVIEENNGMKDVPVTSIQLPISSNNNVFTVMIVGPGMNTKIEINEEDDLMILDAMISKIKKKLKEGSE